MPGVVSGSIFIFVLTVGEYGTVRVIGGNAVSSVGTIVQSKVELAVQYPQGAASAVLLVLALVVGVVVITRFSQLGEEFCRGGTHVSPTGPLLLRSARP